MPESAWGRGIQAVYVLGYFGFVALAGYESWGRLAFTDWWTYLAFQLVYAAFWPLLLAKALFF